ncbi:A disintegrin and metalloproteinase with thrombospondin motifs 9-like isoform X2 [Ptychodera flava]|uniref:A disintegrin and metalloproteinase with thrombospondin motifs 9-like isoform X2 n=1 Tax=Ptychodera flava TaxID=63121 RepID=UPI00396AA834
MNVFRLTLLLFYLGVLARRDNAGVITKADEAEKVGLVSYGTRDRSDKTAESEGSSQRRLRRQPFQRYTWVQGSDFTECSVTCGFGLRSRVVTCYDYVTQTFVSDSICEQSGVEKLEPEVVECDQGPCPGGYVYNVTDWQECNVTCAAGGFQVREVYCTEQSSGQLMNGTHCENEQLVRPASLRPCQNFSLCFLHEYEVGNWSQCSVTCGRDGYQRRNVSCLDIETGIERPDAYCEENGLLKPESHRLCSNMSDCMFNNYSYETDEWSQCNVTCGREGFQVRDVYCKELLTGQIVNETECENALLVKPETQRLCQNFSLCNLHKYEVGNWSQCSVTCGTNGYEDRNVSCVEVNTGIAKSDTHCEEEGLLKPESHRPCQNMSDCVFNMYYYETSEWSQCSVTCGQGNMTRTVKCVNELTGVRIGDSFCAAEVKPNTSQPCQQQECVPDPIYYDYVTGSWRPCDCITGIQWRPFHCVQLGSENLEIMNSSHCESQSIPHPTTVRECPADECPGIWRVTEWSDCSVTCGNGTRQRHSYCVLQTNERILLDARNCNSTAAPLLAESCIIEQCATRYHWLPDQWGQCNSTCGLTFRSMSSCVL